MTIKVGDKLPAGKLSEFIEVESAGCTVGPNTFNVEDLTRGKKVAIFGLARRVHADVLGEARAELSANIDKLKAKGVSDVICMSVNDPFVMGAWARDQKTGGKIRMMGDGSADYTKALGLEFDLAAKGLGMRCQRFSMLVDDGVVKHSEHRGAGQIRSLGRRDAAEADGLTRAAAELHGAAISGPASRHLLRRRRRRPRVELVGGERIARRPEVVIVIPVEMLAGRFARAKLRRQIEKRHPQVLARLARCAPACTWNSGPLIDVTLRPPKRCLNGM